MFNKFALPNSFVALILAVLIIIEVILVTKWFVVKDINNESESLTISPTLAMQQPSVIGAKSDRIPRRKPRPTKVPTPTPTIMPTKVPTPTLAPNNTPYKMLKDVGEAYMDYFGLTKNDFQLMKDRGVNLIEGNFDICAYDIDVKYFLDTSAQYGIKVIMPAGSGEAEWGYICDKVAPKDQKPIWQKEKVQAWVAKWKYHPAIYGWDTSNEAGLNFPNANEGKNLNMFLTLEQMQQAYKDVKAIDPSRPILIRMMGWIFYENEKDYFTYDKGNPFGPGVADIVMVNAYSNVADYYADFVPSVSKKTHDAVLAVNPNAKIVIALGLWTEPPLWYKPSVAQLTADIASARKTVPDMLGLAYFKYGATGSEWYLPSNTIGAPELFDVIAAK